MWKAFVTCTPCSTRRTTCRKLPGNKKLTDPNWRNWKPDVGCNLFRGLFVFHGLWQASLLLSSIYVEMSVDWVTIVVWTLGVTVFFLFVRYQQKSPATCMASWAYRGFSGGTNGGYFDIHTCCVCMKSIFQWRLVQEALEKKRKAELSEPGCGELVHGLKRPRLACELHQDSDSDTLKKRSSESVKQKERREKLSGDLCEKDISGDHHRRRRHRHHHDKRDGHDNHGTRDHSQGHGRHSHAAAPDHSLKCRDIGQATLNLEDPTKVVSKEQALKYEDRVRRAKSRQRRNEESGQVTLADLKYGRRVQNFVKAPNGECEICRLCCAVRYCVASGVKRERPWEKAEEKAQQLERYGLGRNERRKKNLSSSSSEFASKTLRDSALLPPVQKNQDRHSKRDTTSSGQSGNQTGSDPCEKDISGDPDRHHRRRRHRRRHRHHHDKRDGHDNHGTRDHSQGHGRHSHAAAPDHSLKCRDIGQATLNLEDPTRVVNKEQALKHEDRVRRAKSRQRKNEESDTSESSS